MTLFSLHLLEDWPTTQETDCFAERRLPEQRRPQLSRALLLRSQLWVPRSRAKSRIIYAYSSLVTWLTNLKLAVFHKDTSIVVRPGLVTILASSPLLPLLPSCFLSSFPFFFFSSTLTSLLFSPDTAISGNGNIPTYNSMCSFSCRYGWCPINLCTPKSYGTLVDLPAASPKVGTYRTTLTTTEPLLCRFTSTYGQADMDYCFVPPPPPSTTLQPTTTTIITTTPEPSPQPERKGHPPNSSPLERKYQPALGKKPSPLPRV